MWKLLLLYFKICWEGLISKTIFLWSSSTECYSSGICYISTKFEFLDNLFLLDRIFFLPRSTGFFLAVFISYKHIKFWCDWKFLLLCILEYYLIDDIIFERVSSLCNSDCKLESEDFTELIPFAILFYFIPLRCFLSLFTSLLARWLDLFSYFMYPSLHSI